MLDPHCSIPCRPVFQNTWFGSRWRARYLSINPTSANTINSPTGRKLRWLERTQMRCCQHPWWIKDPGEVQTKPGICFITLGFLPVQNTSTGRKNCHPFRSFELLWGPGLPQSQKEMRVFSGIEAVIRHCNEYGSSATTRLCMRSTAWRSS